MVEPVTIGEGGRQLAIGERGDAVVADTVDRSGTAGSAAGVEVRVRSARGTFGRPQRIGPSRGRVDRGRFGAPADLGPGDLEGAIADADGNTLLVFRSYNVLRASFRAAGEPAFRRPRASPPR